MPIIFAHRGANQLAPENTLSAFNKAYQLGARAFEFDVQISSDFVPIVFHDTELARTTNGKGCVSEKTFSELRVLDAGSWFRPDFSFERIHTLEEVLEVLLPLGVFLNIELKINPLGNVPLVNAVLASLNKYPQYVTQIFLSSFHREALQSLFQAGPQYARGLLVKQKNEDILSFAKKIECQSVNLSLELLSSYGAQWIEQAHKENLKVFCFTMNDPSEVQHWLSQGLDGFFTDNAALYLL